MQNRARVLAAMVATVALIAACDDDIDSTGVENTTQVYNGSLNGANERPTPITTTATGFATLNVTVAGVMTYTVGWQGLTGAVTGAHIHGPADANGVADIIVDFMTQTITTTPSGQATGTVNVTGAGIIGNGVSGDSLRKLLDAGMVYVNIHTAAHPTGEIRAQISKQ